MPEQKNRTLTDEDVQAITDSMEARMAARFYGDLGKGVWSLAWKAIIVAIVGIAAYGSLKGMK
jgi:hypothetical protein